MDGFLGRSRELRLEKHRVLEEFVQLQSKGVNFDEVVLVMVLRICTVLMNELLVFVIHGGLIKRGVVRSDTRVASALMSFYGKCFGYRQRVFRRDDITWNKIVTVNLRSGEWEKAVKLFREMQFCYGKVYDGTMVKLLQVCSNKGGFAEGRQIHGYKGAIEILRRMQVSGLKPNSTSITSLLQAVAEPGLLKLGKAIHGYVIRNQLCYDVYVETTLIDMYVKTGCLPYAKMVSDTMAEKKNIVAWNSLISGLSYAGLMKLLPS
ncbi:LOW QUALITY PROTEIN: hypothetical protein Bca101_087969 [Brassica carinata]